MSIHLDEEAASFDPDADDCAAIPRCIGVLGENGRCRLCGRQGEGEEPLSAASDEDAPDLSSSDEESDEAGKQSCGVRWIGSCVRQRRNGRSATVRRSRLHWGLKFRRSL